MSEQTIYFSANHTEVANSIVKTGINGKNHGVTEIFVSSVLAKKTLNLMPLFLESTINCENCVKEMAFINH